MGDYSLISELKGFFACKETSGTFLRDSVSGLKWDVSSNGESLVFSTASGGIGYTADPSNPPVNFTGGVSPQLLSSKRYLYFCSGRLTGIETFKCSFGDINEILPEYVGIGSGYGQSDHPFHVAVGNHGSYLKMQNTSGIELDSLAVTNPFDITVVSLYDGVGQTLSQIAYRNSDGSAILDCLTNTSTSTIGNISPNPCFRYSGIELYGVQLWEFSVFPSDVIAGALWMGKEWSLGGSHRGAIYPPWNSSRTAGISTY